MIKDESRRVNLPDLVGGRPVRHRLGYGVSRTPRTGLAKSGDLSGLPKSLYVA